MGRKRFRWRTFWLIMLPPVLALLGIASYLGSGLWPCAPVDVRKLKRADHPLYQLAVRKDGSVDYFEALNQHRFDGVRNDLNFAVTVLETRDPVYGPIPPQALKEYFRWMEFTYPPTTVLQPPSNNVAAEHLQGGSDWKIGDAKTVEALKAALEPNQAVLDRWVEDADRCQFFRVPIALVYKSATGRLIPGPNAFYNHSVEDSSIAIVKWLRVRILVALQEGDLDSAWRDLRAGLQVAKLISQSFSGTYFVMAYDSWLLPVFLDLMNHPDLSDPLLERIGNELPTLLARKSLNDLMNWESRAFAGFLMDRSLLQGHHPLAYEEGEWGPGFLPPGWIRAVAMIDRNNELLDQGLEGLGTRGTPRQKTEMWAEVMQSKRGVTPGDILWSPFSNASQLALEAMPPLATTSEDALGLMKAATNNRLYRMFVAIRQFEQEYGRLPEQPSDLQPWLAKEDLQDPYTDKSWEWQLELPESITMTTRIQNAATYSIWVIKRQTSR